MQRASHMREEKHENLLRLLVTPHLPSPSERCKKKWCMRGIWVLIKKTKENRTEPKPKEKLLVLRKKPKKIFHKMNL